MPVWKYRCSEVWMAARPSVHPQQCSVCLWESWRDSQQSCCLQGWGWQCDPAVLNAVHSILPLPAGFNCHRLLSQAWWNTFTEWDLIFWSFISSCLWQLVFIFYQLLLSPYKITVRFGSSSPLTPQILLSLVGMYILGQFRLCQCCHREKHNFCFVSSPSVQDFPSFVNWKCLWKWHISLSSLEFFLCIFFVFFVGFF